MKVRIFLIYLGSKLFKECELIFGTSRLSNVRKNPYLVTLLIGTEIDFNEVIFHSNKS